MLSKKFAYRLSSNWPGIGKCKREGGIDTGGGGKCKREGGLDGGGGGKVKKGGVDAGGGGDAEPEFE